MRYLFLLLILVGCSGVRPLEEARPAPELSKDVVVVSEAYINTCAVCDSTYVASIRIDGRSCIVAVTPGGGTALDCL